MPPTVSKRPAWPRYQIETFTTTAGRNYLVLVTAPVYATDLGRAAVPELSIWLALGAVGRVFAAEDRWLVELPVRPEVSVREHGRPA